MLRVSYRLSRQLGGYHQWTVAGLIVTPLSYIYTYILYLVVSSSSNVLSSSRTRMCTQLGLSLVIVKSLAQLLTIPNILTIFLWSLARSWHSIVQTGKLEAMPLFMSSLCKILLLKWGTREVLVLMVVLSFVCCGLLYISFKRII